MTRTVQARESQRRIVRATCRVYDGGPEITGLHGSSRKASALMGWAYMGAIAFSRDGSSVFHTI